LDPGGTGSAATGGKRTIGVPRVQASLGAEWDLPMLNGFSLDARVVEVQGRALTLRLRIDNLADRNYWASVGGYPGTAYLVVGGPRAYSLGASVDF
jgi:iron complex outermembrane receptor protein